MQARSWWEIGIHRRDFRVVRLQKSQRCIGWSSEKVICDIIVHQKGTQDSGEDDEIAVDARSRCRIIKGQGPLGKHGRAVRSRVFSLASLRTNRENVTK